MASMIELFRLVLKNMFEKKGRVALTISGIVIGIFTFVFFIFVSQGLENAITEQFTSVGVNVLGVVSANNQVNGPPSGVGLTDTDIAKIKQVISDYKYVAPGIAGQQLYEYGRNKAVITSISYPDEFIEDISTDLNIEIEYGRGLRSGDKGVLVLGAKTAREGFGKDSEVKVGSSIKLGDKSFRVIGIIKERGDLFIDSSMMMSFDDAKATFEQETYSSIRIAFVDGADLEANQKAIERKLNPNGKEKRINVTSPTQVLEQFNQILGLLTGIISFISSVALLVGGINVLNTMYSNVLERINEISVMKAIGATNSDIRTLFLIESSILGLIGAFVGFMCAYILAEILSYIITTYLNYNVAIYFGFGFFFTTILVTASFAMLFGTYPAIRASRVNPADNLRGD
ncbi:MAG: ABC transporter permease [Candidatus Woesearchaeota archaeon]|jgi:putative ABC transport system permease protein|nr:ABC transporter permease [Candidatus Woesearchaeota archaeon]